jgi:hypothetical protein
MIVREPQLDQPIGAFANFRTFLDPPQATRWKSFLFSSIALAERA